LQNHDFSFFTQHTTKSQNQAKTPKSWNLALHKPYQDQFLSLSNFSNNFGGICEDLVQPDLQNHNFSFSAHTPPSHNIKPKHRNHGTWLCTNQAKINSFWSQTSPISL